MKKFKSISTKLLLGIGVITLISLTSNLLITNYIGKGILKKTTDESLNNVTNQVYSLLESSVELSIKNYLRGIAEKNKEITDSYYKKYKNGELTQDELLKKISEILLSQKIGKTGYIYGLSSQGILKIHPKQTLINADVNKYDFVQKQKVKKEGYLEYMWKNPDEAVERKKALYMTYYEPLDLIISASSYRDEFKDLLNIRDLRDKILGVKLGKTGYPFIVDSDGNLIIHPTMENKNIINIQDEDGDYIIKDMIKIKNGTYEYNWKDPDKNYSRSKIAYLRYLQNMKWIVVASTYLDELNEPLIDLRNNLIGVGILILFIMLGSTYFFAKKIGNPIKVLAAKAELMAGGNLNVEINTETNDEIGILSEALNKMKCTITSIISEINQLSDKAINGKLDNRADAEKYTGEFKVLIEGLNKTLDSIINPLMFTAENIDRISKGNIPDELEVEMKGDFNIIKDNLNQCIYSINQLVSDSKMLFGSAISGDLNFRADIEKHNGEFKNIISGVNSTLDRLVGLIDEMPLSIQISDADNNVVYKNKFKLNQTNES